MCKDAGIFFHFVGNENPDGHCEKGRYQNPAQNLRIDEGGNGGAEKSGYGMVGDGSGENAQTDGHRRTKARRKEKRKQLRFIPDFSGRDDSRGDADKLK